MANVIRLTPGNAGEPERPRPRPGTVTADESSPGDGFGQELCKARQRGGRTLMDVWHDIKIPPHHLIAIENGRFDELPGRVYAVGYVRTYATYLGIDAEPLVARLKAEMGQAGEDVVLASPQAPRRNKESAGEEIWRGDANESEFGAASDPSLLPALFGGLLIGLLIYCGVYVFTASRQLAMPPVTPVPERLAAEAGLVQKAAKAVRASPSVRPFSVARDTPHSQPLQLPHTGGAPVRALVSVLPISIAIAEPALTLPASDPVPAARAPQRNPPPASAVKSIAPARPIAVADFRPARFHDPLPLGRRYGLQDGKSRITLRLHRTTHVVVQGPHNRILIDRVFAAGDVYRIPDQAGLKLMAQDAGAVELILDDSTIGFAGKDGALTRGLPLDPKNIAHRAKAD